MRFRRTVVFENLNRSRLDEAWARRTLYPSSERRGLFGVFVVSSAAYIKEQSGTANSGLRTHKEGGSK
jgi:hypothetical protein